MRRNKGKIRDGLQLITPLEDGEDYLIDPDKAPKYRVPKPACTAPSGGNRRRRRKKQASDVSEKSPDSQLSTENVATTADQESTALPKYSDEDLDVQDAILESHKDNVTVQKDVRRNPSKETE